MLERLLSIFNDFFLSSRVDRVMFSLAAALHVPHTRPRFSLKAVSFDPFSLPAGLCESSTWLCRSLATGCRESHLSSTEKSAPSHMITERSMTFCNSRILPGQG